MPSFFGGSYHHLLSRVVHFSFPFLVHYCIPVDNSIGAFAYTEAESAVPKAVMGMLGVEGRKVMRRRFRDDILALTLPAPLFMRMEQEANDCIFQIPSWEKFIKH